MGNNKVLVFSGMVACLTICQIGWAKAPEKTSTRARLEARMRLEESKSHSKTVLKAEPKSRAAKSVVDSRAKAAAKTENQATQISSPQPKAKAATQTVAASAKTVAETQPKTQAAPPVESMPEEQDTTTAVSFEDENSLADTETAASLEAENAMRLETRLLRKKKARNFARSPLIETPASRQYMFSLSLMGTTNNSQVTSTNWNSPGQYKNESTGFNTTLSAKYGFTRNFYVGAGLGFETGKSTSTTNNGSTLTASTSDSKNEGIHEPTVTVGAQTLLGKVRLIGEVNTKIPVGPSKRRIEGNTSVSDGLSGGSAIAPQIGAIAELGPVRLIGSTTYTFRQERKIERSTYGYTENQTVTGGDSLEVLAGIELPQALNVGLAAIYSRTEPSTTRNSTLGGGTTSSSGTTTNLIGGVTYAEIPVVENFKVRPTFMYATLLDREVPDMQVDKMDVMAFGINTQLTF